MPIGDKGYWGKMLEINLNTSTFTKDSNRHMHYTDQYINGRGLAMKLLWEALKDLPGADPLGRNNPIIITPGVVGGLPFTGFNRYEIVSKSALTQAKNPRFGESSSTVACADAGGFFGAALKMAGYDLLFLNEQCSAWKYLYINEDQVSLEDATQYVNMTSGEFEQAMKKKYDGAHAVLSIGPAAVKGVRFAALMSEVCRVNGSAGMGAVMASKRLKGIVVFGSKIPPFAGTYAQLRTLKETTDQAAWKNENTQWRTIYGTASLFNQNNADCRKPATNFSEGWFPNPNKVFTAVMYAYWRKHNACYACLTRCGKSGRVQTGKYHNLVSQGPEYEHSMCHSNWGIQELEDLGAIMTKLRELGLDVVATGGVVGFALEAFGKGDLTQADLGQQLRWGNTDEILDFLDKLVNNTGQIYQWLRRGATYAANKIGKNSVKYAMDSKNQSYDAWAIVPTDLAGQAAIAAANAGPSYADGFGVNAIVSAGRRSAGVYCDYGISGLVTVSGNYPLNIINFVLGKEFNVADFDRFGERVVNLERVFNLREGFTKADDTLADKSFDQEQAYSVGTYKGWFRGKLEFEAMMVQEYRKMSWNDNGVPTGNKLIELGLSDLISQIP
ncbi:MAG: hypothetical protein FWE85_00365 [Clostridiales bacterium]|nr:hypothetical protein [Clostridiales bacterium]